MKKEKVVNNNSKGCGTNTWFYMNKITLSTENYSFVASTVMPYNVEIKEGSLTLGY